MATYYVSGVWKDARGFVTHLFLHSGDDTHLFEGKRVRIDAAVKLISQGHNLMTVKWDYQSAKWVDGALVEISDRRNGIMNLKTQKDSVLSESLDNMIQYMHW
jgi:hypothetical protein